ncbi:hypothetical protein B296_00033919 [Ensete ventricosum]|uniref:Uncharacterized protein n=1 Tax=Ensete ventricosum TaxID=4639 RepID=A0A426X8N9_ENSVE|nr:hypothetical protein B296_00033919 [Ensete ventricosum]
MLLGREAGSVVSNKGRLDPAGSDPSEHECLPRSMLAKVATPSGRLSGKGAAAETKGKSRRSSDLKGCVVEEGEAEASGGRGDAVRVSMTGLGNGCFEIGDMAGGFTGAGEEMMLVAVQQWMTGLRLLGEDASSVGQRKGRCYHRTTKERSRRYRGESASKRRGGQEDRSGLAAGLQRCIRESAQGEGDALGIIGSAILSLLHGGLRAAGMASDELDLNLRILEGETELMTLQKRSRPTAAASHAARHRGDLLPFDSGSRGGGRRGPWLWPARAVTTAVIFRAGEKGVAPENGCWKRLFFVFVWKQRSRLQRRSVTSGWQRTDEGAGVGAG